MPPSKNTRLPVATLKHPTIEAILGGHFRFATQKQATDRLKAVRESFTVAKLPPDVDPDPSALKLWIRGYGLTAEAREEGYLGHYAQLRVKELPEDGKWTIEAAVLNIDKKYHPQRRQTEQKFPNWGHPILRDIKKGRTHKTTESAQSELTRLHEAFPEVSIPLSGKLYLMVYGKAAEEGGSPVQKWVFEIAATEAGEFTIAYKPNTHKPKEKSPQPAASKGVAEDIPQGKFTTEVLLKRAKRKPAKRIKPKGNAE